MHAVSPAAAGEILDLTRSTVIRLIKAGEIPAVRLGRQWRIRVSDLEAIMQPKRAGGDNGEAA